MKKGLCVFLVLTLALTALCFPALAQEEDPFTWEQIDAGMETLSAWLEAEGWKAPTEGTLK